MGKRRDWIEALLFLPAMAALAGVLFVAFWLVMQLGGFLVDTTYRMFALALPRPVALALAVILTAFVVATLFELANRRRKPRIKA